ncbi:MAG: GNAT family N-acetyltransferase [Candidatus Acidiferrales bacterium]
MNFLFYVAHSGQAQDTSLEPDCRLEIWKPTYRKPVPPGQPWLPFLIYWLFHKARIFANQDYSVVLVWKGNRPVHRTLVLPRYFRFPFMGPEDLQVAMTWTDPRFRGRGLALAAARIAIATAGPSARKLWYLTSASNQPSIRVAEKAGFRLYGTGSRRTRFGFNFLGTYSLDEAHPPWERGEREQRLAKRVAQAALSMTRLLLFSPLLLGAALIARLRQADGPATEPR